MLIQRTKKYSKPITSLLLMLLLLVSTFSPILLRADTDTTNSSSSDETVIDTPSTQIETGSSVAVDDIYSTANTNVLETEVDQEDVLATSSQNTTEITTGTTTATSSDSDQASSTPPSVIELQNNSTSTTNASTSALSGSNQIIASNTGENTITTGDAFAYTNVVNLSNTNIINSNGFITFMSQIFGQDTVDVRGLFDIFTDGGQTTPCKETGCGPTTDQYHISNQSSTTNTISTTAETGNNQVSGSSTIIRTGNAYALSNLTNIVNTNIIEANYLLFTFSNFGDMLGDILLPNKHLFNTLFSQTSNDTIDATITNQATITNNLSVAADTGNNTSSSTAESTTNTGNATSYANTYNQINQNIINDDSFSMLFRVHGDWDGQVFGLPDNLSWEHTAAGVSITNNTTQSSLRPQNISVTASNDAVLTNNVTATANTGNNNANQTNQSDTQTGDAFAAANITNIANTNILGRNWSLLIFDIFGDWQGNISFGQPDVWIGGSAHVSNGQARAGSEILYTITVSNLGDVVAKNVQLAGLLSSDLITLEKEMDVDLGSIEPGQTIVHTFPARVSTELPYGSHPIDLTAQLSVNQTELSTDNNQEVITIIAENVRRSSGGSSKSKSITDPGDIVISKTISTSTITPGDTVGYTIVIKNNGGPVFDSILYDTLYDTNGIVMLDQHWPLHTIADGETITVTYDIAFASTSVPGTYINSAQVLGFHEKSKTNQRREYDSVIASIPLQVGSTSPRVLGISTTAACDPFLTTHLKIGTENNQFEVAKLQAFLNVFTDQTIPVTGVFDATTDQAVRHFQTLHQNTILKPWGLHEPTGYVYYTTKQKINELYCGASKTFPLSPLQQAEITLYRVRLTSLQ